MKTITELQVQILSDGHEKKNKKYWVVARCDIDPGLVGNIESVGVGLPARACNVPEGSTFTTIFEVPGRKHTPKSNGGKNVRTRKR